MTRSVRVPYALRNRYALNVHVSSAHSTRNAFPNKTDYLFSVCILAYCWHTTCQRVRTTCELYTTKKGQHHGDTPKAKHLATR